MGKERQERKRVYTKSDSSKAKPKKAKFQFAHRL